MTKLELNFQNPWADDRQGSVTKFQLCTECWLRKHPDQFEPDSDKCKDCREQ